MLLQQSVLELRQSVLELQQKPCEKNKKGQLDHLHSITNIQGINKQRIVGVEENYPNPMSTSQRSLHDENIKSRNNSSMTDYI